MSESSTEERSSYGNSDQIMIRGNEGLNVDKYDQHMYNTSNESLKNAHSLADIWKC